MPFKLSPLFKKRKPYEANPRITGQSKIDFTLLLTVLGLTLFGLVMVYDASVIQAHKDFGDKYYYIKQQLLSATIGLVALFSVSLFNYHFYKKLSLVVFLFCFVLILAVFIPGIGSSGGGAHRWIRVFGFSIQPAELIKIATVILFASLFEKRPRNGPFFLVTFIVTAILAVLQRDLGSAIVYFLVCFGVFYYAGASLKFIYYLIPITILGFITFVATSAYRLRRVSAFLDPFSDPQGYTYHISQVLIALGSGGLFGLGLGQSRQKFAYIPEVTTDSIFSIVGEELGFFGCLVFIALVVFLIYRGFKIAQNASDNYGRLLAFGITFWLGTQAVVNLAAMVSLIPLTGVPLPFISFGGSALIVNLASVGILLNISKNSEG